MPAAFAATKYDPLRMYADSDDEYYLIYDGDFDEEDLYDDVKYYDGYFIIRNEDDGPTVRSDEDDSNVEGDKLWYDPGSHDYDIDDVYFDTGDYNYDDDVYEYTIYGYEYDGSRIGSMTIYLYVDSDSSSSSDGDIYAEIDRNGCVDLYDYEEDIYDYGLDNLDGTPDYIRFTGWGNGDLYDYNDKEVSTKTYFDLETSKRDSDLEYYEIYFEIDDDSKEAYINFTIYDDGNDSCTGTIVINGDGSSSGDITYSCDYNSEVYFEGSDFEDLLTSRQTLSYVTFTLPASTKGTLYLGNSKLSGSDKLDSDDLDEVSFTPKSGVTGNVSISFKVYYTTTTSSRTSSMSGTVVVSIDDGTTITYDGELDDYIEFDSDDFDDVCYEVTGKYLDYVKFSPTSSKGTLYAEYDGTSQGQHHGQVHRQVLYRPRQERLRPGRRGICAQDQRRH